MIKLISISWRVWSNTAPSVIFGHVDNFGRVRSFLTTWVASKRVISINQRISVNSMWKLANVKNSLKSSPDFGLEICELSLNTRKKALILSVADKDGLKVTCNFFRNAARDFSHYFLWTCNLTLLLDFCYRSLRW